MTLPRLAPLALAAGLALTLAACGDDDPVPSGSSAQEATTSAESGDVDRYCALVEQMNALGEEIFGPIGEDAPAAEIQAAEQQLVDRGAAVLEEMEQVAPAEIQDDVAVFDDDMRARAATGQSPDEEAAGAAEENARAFADEHCPGGADGS